MSNQTEHTSAESEIKMPFYFVQGKKRHRRIYDPSRSAAYQEYIEDERTGGKRLKEIFPLAASSPKALLAVDAQMLADMLVHRADENGDTVTEDPDIARRALDNNPKATMHPYSMKLPNREKRDKRNKQAG